MARLMALRTAVRARSRGSANARVRPPRPVAWRSSASRASSSARSRRCAATVAAHLRLTEFAVRFCDPAPVGGAGTLVEHRLRARRRERWRPGFRRQVQRGDRPARAGEQLGQVAHAEPVGHDRAPFAARQYPVADWRADGGGSAGDLGQAPLARRSPSCGIPMASAASRASASRSAGSRPVVAGAVPAQQRLARLGHGDRGDRAVAEQAVGATACVQVLGRASAIAEGERGQPEDPVRPSRGR